MWVLSTCTRATELEGQDVVPGTGQMRVSVDLVESRKRQGHTHPWSRNIRIPSPSVIDPEAASPPPTPKPKVQIPVCLTQEEESPAEDSVDLAPTA